MRPRDNPFRVDRVRSLPYRLPPGESWDGLLERLGGLAREHGAAVIVGPEGRGKTTLLGELTRRLRDRGEIVRSVTLERGQRELTREQWRTLADGDWHCIDGLEQLGPWRRRRLHRHAAHRRARLLVTAHRPLSPRRRWPELLRSPSSPELLEELMERLTESAPGLPSLPAADELHDRHGGNLALALLEAYDRCAAV